MDGDTRTYRLVLTLPSGTITRCVEFDGEKIVGASDFDGPRELSPDYKGAMEAFLRVHESSGYEGRAFVLEGGLA